MTDAPLPQRQPGEAGETSEDRDLHADLVYQSLRTIMGLSGHDLPLVTHRFTAIVGPGVVSGTITGWVSEHVVQLTEDDGTPHDVHFSQFCGLTRVTG